MKVFLNSNFKGGYDNMTLQEMLDMPIESDEDVIKWLRIYRKWYKAEARRHKIKIAQMKNK
jgi:hypothetical protein